MAFQQVLSSKPDWPSGVVDLLIFNLGEQGGKEVRGLLPDDSRALGHGRVYEPQRTLALEIVAPMPAFGICSFLGPRPLPSSVFPMNIPSRSRESQDVARFG